MWWNPLTDSCVQECYPTCARTGFPRLSSAPPIPLQPSPFTLNDRNLLLRDPAACVCVLKHRHITSIDLLLTIVVPCVRVFNVKHIALAGHLLSLSFSLLYYNDTQLSNLKKNLMFLSIILSLRIYYIVVFDEIHHLEEQTIIEVFFNLI
jgi:hypothetical protein